MPKTIETIQDDLTYPEIDIDSGLRLKQLNATQAEQLFSMTQKDMEYLSKWLPWPKHTHSSKDSKAFIESVAQKRSKGEEYGFGIESYGNLVGHISLMHLKDDKEPEIGYWVASNSSRQGVTTKAAIALTQFGLDTLKLKKIIIRAHPDNIGSNKVAEKAGYRFGYLGEDEDGPLNIWEITP
ncbi:MAG: GNAT family N-acetyltransferase [Candidatus Saccharibacteria bacterium]|nr:GNAT family N-acetyltransferase [Candidatus Saccharibacteria bacterium]